MSLTSFHRERVEAGWANARFPKMPCTGGIRRNKTRWLPGELKQSFRRQILRFPNQEAAIDVDPTMEISTCLAVTPRITAITFFVSCGVSILLQKCGT